MAAELVLRAPLAGWCGPLGEVPDLVFAEKMLGDGLAIDPTEGVLHSPCDATVLSVHASRHAITLRTGQGVEILIHVGLETVALGGDGFAVEVSEGAQVAAGDRLLAFDLKRLADGARSLITPIVVTDLAGGQLRPLASGRSVGVGEPILALAGLTGATAGQSGGGPDARRDLVVILRHGLHARPAARIAELAKSFAADVRVVCGVREANAKSPVSLMAAGVRHGDAISVLASGADAETAVEALAELIASGMGEGAPLPEAAPDEPAPTPTSPPNLLRGVTAAPGLAVGRAFRLFLREIEVAERGRGLIVERAALAEALRQVRERIEAEAAEGDKARRAILAAHAAFLDDPELTGQAERHIAQGKSAGFAWRAAVGAYVEALRGLGDRRMAERVDDLIDLERRVLIALSGEDDAPLEPPPGSIVLADELLPSQVMALGKAGGVVTGRGGPTSHVAILAASMGLPAIVAAGPLVASVPDGATLILDADAGVVRISPDAETLASAQSVLAARHERRRASRAAALQECRLADGSRLEVFANLGSIRDAEGALASGAEGCGLLRTEFLFLERDTPPDEEEQLEQYAAIAWALQGKPLIIRLLDVGGDKTAPYLPIPPEENPALGQRGVRVQLRRPHLLKTQIRAILRAAPAGQCKILTPMVASLAELRAVRTVLEEARRELGVEGRVDLGVMIETPAAAMTADLLAAEADFLSVGTNDLTQYTLAMDRGNPELAPEVDAFHPAVLRLIGQAVAGGRAHALWTGVCGGLAAEPAAAPILIGLGVTELSMPAAAIAEVKALARTLSPEACRRVAEEALRQTSPEAVRDLANTFLTGGA